MTESEESVKEFLTSNEWQHRLGRTIVQGVVGVFVSYIDLIVGYAAIPEPLRPVVVGLVMAVLSPIMAMLGEKGDADK